MQISVQCNYNKCLKLAKSLKIAVGKYKSCFELNLNQDSRVLMKKTLTTDRLAIHSYLGC